MPPLCVCGPVRPPSDCTVHAPLDPNPHPQDGVTPLCAASVNGRAPVMRMLLEAGADKEAAMKVGWGTDHCSNGALPTVGSK